MKISVNSAYITDVDDEEYLGAIIIKAHSELLTVEVVPHPTVGGSVNLRVRYAGFGPDIISDLSEDDRLWNFLQWVQETGIKSYGYHGSSPVSKLAGKRAPKLTPTTTTTNDDEG